MCPHVERDDPRCGSRFNLARLDQAFTVCFGAFHGCPMYHRINAECGRQTDPRPERAPLTAAATAGRAAAALTRRDAHDPPLITLTTHGRPLRATGT